MWTIKGEMEKYKPDIVYDMLVSIINNIDFKIRGVTLVAVINYVTHVERENMMFHVLSQLKCPAYLSTDDFWKW